MADKLPELSTIAYDRYVGNHNMNLGDLSAIQSAERNDYTKYLDQMQQYNTDRSFEYGKWTDELSHRKSEREEKRGLEKSERDKQMELAIIAADKGDYSLLEKLGINTANNGTDWERKYNAAALAAQYGDFSGFKSLGYTDAQINEMRRQWQIQQWR